MGELVLQFKTYYTINEEGAGAEKHCYEAWSVTPLIEGDNPSDSDLIDTVRNIQEKIFEEAGYKIHEVKLHRPSEFEYKRYLKQNEKARYYKALQRG